MATVSLQPTRLRLRARGAAESPGLRTPRRFPFEIEPDGDGCPLVFIQVFGGFLAEEGAHHGVAALRERYAD
jgi:hypothetical protein